MKHAAFPLGEHRPRRSAGSRWVIWARATLVLLALATAPPARATATLTIAALPAGVMADGATEAVVLCSIANGYPNNRYALKGTFSPGDLPYYGLTYNPLSTMWVAQIGSWDKAQPQVMTDARGEWRGYLAVRLERAAPRGEMLFRFSAIPLSPVGNPGPTVSPWQAIYALEPDTTGGWMRGHVYRDPACTVPASGIVVQAEDAYGRILGAYLSQDSRVVDGEDRADAGLIALGLPRGTVYALRGRLRGDTQDGPPGAPVTLYTRTRPPWRVEAGRTLDLDAPPWGDADGDGALTLADAALAARVAGGLAGPLADGHSADVWPAPPDGRVTLADALAILRRALAMDAARGPLPAPICP